MNSKNIKTVLGVIILLLSVSVGLIGLYGQNKNTDNITPVSSSSDSKKVNDSSKTTNPTTNQTTSNSSNTNKNKEVIKTEDSKSKIKLSLGGADVHTAGLREIRVYVTNNSSRNIKYIKVNLFEKKDGSIVQSDWTNDSSLIKAGASQTIDTYFDFHWSESTLEVELGDVIFQ